MRDYLYSQRTYQQRKLPSIERLRREELPACALFLLLYAFGASCGMAACEDGYRAEILPSVAAIFADSRWRDTALHALLYSFFAAGTQAALMLLSGLSVWLMTLWTAAVFLRAVAVGVCVSLCLDALRSGAAHALSIVSVAAAAFLITFGAELRLCILPLVRRILPAADDAAYLAVGIRFALRFLLISILMTAASLLLLRHLVHA